MNKPLDEATLALAKFGVGQPVPRKEDPVLVQGAGRYTDDLSLDGQLYAAFVRSPYAHGVLEGIDIEAARAMPGVVAIYTAADLAPENYGVLTCSLPLKNGDGSPMHYVRHPPLAGDKVRFVGDAVAFVVAESAVAAQDAAEAVGIAVEPLEAVTDGRAAMAPGAPQLYDEAPNNIVLDARTGDAAAVDAAFAAAHHVTKLRLVVTRVVVNPMEPRGALGAYDPQSGRYTLRSATQGVFGMRQSAANAMGVPVDRIRVLTGHVGGSFGMKSAMFSEYVCLLHAARVLGRPVKWIDRRSESFVADHHGRDHEIDAELALDAQGTFLAARIAGFGNVGAYLSTFAPMIPASNIVRNMVSVYRTPLVASAVKVVVTNTSAIGPYRGAGRPEGNYVMERLIETAAREMGLDAIALRRRNHIRSQDFPFKAASGMTYDGGDFGGILDHALALSDWDGYAARKAESASRGLVRGRGVGQYLEITAPPTREMGGIHFEDDGGVTIVTGTLDYGQGHATPFAQLLAQSLGVPFASIRLVQGDSDLLIAGGGTGGSKSLMASGAAILEASALVIERGREAASHVLEAGREDIEFARGHFTVAGTDRTIGVVDLARRLRAGGLPEDCPTTLDVDHVHEASPSAFPNGCHVAEVEIDPETGVVEVVKYTMTNDFGVVVNPLLVEGQMHGGVVQGIGQILMETTHYDADGQLLTGSFMDYAMPRAGGLPDFAIGDHPVPTTTNPVGAKGCGEAGCAGSMASVMNAIVDALSIYGITDFQMPASPLRVWRAIDEAKAARKGAA